MLPDKGAFPYGASKIDAGIDIGPGSDLDGNARPCGGDFNGSVVYDMRCYEYVAETFGTLLMIR